MCVCHITVCGGINGSLKHWLKLTPVNTGFPRDNRSPTNWSMGIAGRWIVQIQQGLQESDNGLRWLGWEVALGETWDRWGQKWSPWQLGWVQGCHSQINPHRTLYFSLLT